MTSSDGTVYQYTGWQEIDGVTYYYDPTTHQPVTGQQVIQGDVYTFGADGALNRTARGIDVSKFQGSIDWNAVKADGITFAIIRCGYRGYGSGALVEDSTYRTNIRGAINAGYTSVKLYFMMGLPTETMEDIEGIAETAQKVVDLYYKNTNHAKGRGVQVTISCACFVPKPHTPFQFVPMDTAETLQAKQKHLLESVHSRKIKVNYHDSTTSFLEGVFAKGDRRLAPVIVEAYKRGCYFDGWEECFKYDTWMQTFADLGIDPAFYCQRPIALDEVTPWSHMDYGITHEYLVREYNKALAAQTTPPCNRACNACGANHLLGGPCFDYSQNLV